MDNTNKEKFESLWADFITYVNGKLITTASQQTLTISLANLILREAALTWGSEYEINGRWLLNYKESEPQKAELICEILMKDMKFDEIFVSQEIPSYFNYLVPAIGAIAGLGVSYLAGAGKLVRAISTIVPALLLYPATKKFGEQKAAINAQKNIESFINQLDKYKNSVLSILS